MHFYVQIAFLVSSFFFFFRISSSHIVNSVCWSHALVNGPTSKRPASDGGRCSGQLLMMWSAVCSGSPHSHAALSASREGLATRCELLSDIFHNLLREGLRKTGHAAFQPFVYRAKRRILYAYTTLHVIYRNGC